MSRDFIEHGPRLELDPRPHPQESAPSRHQRDRRGARGRSRRLRDHEVRRGGSAPAAARGQARASTLGCRQRAGRMARALGTGRRRRPDHARGARQQRRRARLLLSSRLLRRRSCCPATTAVARRACAWSRPSACRGPGPCDAATRRGRDRVRCRRRGPGRGPGHADRCQAAAPGRQALAGERRRVRGLAARAELRALGRAPRRARRSSRSCMPARCSTSPLPDAERGREAVVKSWAGIVEGKAIALRWRPGIVNIGGEPTIAVSRGTLHPADDAGRRRRLAASACSRRSGCVIAKDARLARPLRRQRDHRTERRRPCRGRALGRGSADVGLRAGLSRALRSDPEVATSLGADHAALEHAAVGARRIAE